MTEAKEPPFTDEELKALRRLVEDEPVLHKVAEGSRAWTWLTARSKGAALWLVAMAAGGAAAIQIITFFRRIDGGNGP